MNRWTQAFSRVSYECTRSPVLIVDCEFTFFKTKQAQRTDLCNVLLRANQDRNMLHFGAQVLSASDCRRVCCNMKRWL